MQKSYFVGAILLATSVGLAGCIPFLTGKTTTPPNDSAAMMVKDESMNITDKSEDSMVKTDEDTMAKPTTDNMAKDQATESEKMMAAKASYEMYTPAAFAEAAKKRRVLFFHATWCPTCKVANADLEKNIGMLPADVVVFKTDYDTQAELKKKYGITYQHTFVLVDEAGTELMKWNGGDTAMIKEKLGN